MTLGPTSDMKLQRTSRDPASVPPLLEAWLTGELPEGADPKVTIHSGIDSNGMSSETLVFDAEWSEDGETKRGEYVARVAPRDDEFPVFMDYALRDQFEVMRIVGERTEVPVPNVGLFEESGEVLGTPFFLMDRIDGIVPPDVPPYNWGTAPDMDGNWITDASDEERERLQRSTVAAIVGLHAIPDAEQVFGFLDRHDHPGETPLQRNLAWARAWYEWAVPDIGRSPMTETVLDWLEANVPDTSEKETVLCWGDSRIGNVMYRDFEPVGVLDWEMAALGPREMDISWMMFAHQVFESICEVFGFPGMPDFLAEDTIKAMYQDIAGVELDDLTWYDLYNGVLWCVVFMRTGARSLHFGEIEKPEDVESLFHHKPLMEKLMQKAGLA